MNATLRATAYRVGYENFTAFDARLRYYEYDAVDIGAEDRSQ